MTSEPRLKQAVSLAIHDGAGRVLLVQRPPDDEDLPLAWGLPAASLRAGESWPDAVRRAARDKLGVQVRVGDVLSAGHLDRPGYRLEMRLYQALLSPDVAHPEPAAPEPAEPQPAEPQPAEPQPVVPQATPGVTQYVAWRWGSAVDLAPAARSGSLCSRLYLDWSGGPTSP